MADLRKDATARSTADPRKDATACSRVLCVAAPGEVTLVEEELPAVPEGGFRVETVYSGISAGTELTYVKGTNPYLTASWDRTLGLFRPGAPALAYPVRGIGYMQVGRVAETRTGAVREGALVAMAYGHRTGYVADPLADRFVELPAGLDPVLGVYVAHMGPICANGLLHAAADLHGPAVRDLGDGVRGRRVAVVGAGVVGLLTAAFALEHGAAEVVVADETPERLRIAEALGARPLEVDAGDGDGDPAVELKRRWRHGPDDRGADVVFQCRGQARALALALRMLRPQGTVVDLAFYTRGADEVRLGEEFHHNGLSLRCAQIGRVPRGLAHAWDRERLSYETVALLGRRGAALREHLVTEVAAFAEAPRLLADLAARRRHAVQAVLRGDVEDEGG
ncbi:zinc-binding dehydrogenase [Nonomuraea roseoviolacea]|uniref:Threonine dehydrogenase-like Zn-dependent dehydrogenase n=1 Tax=Nonomuraea roseoviolacea subsp. carminata TaxID=160689 RepID=A0ABT1JV57_9ACTN|nr:zinc-binding dehydrogenase [Nonomuraea roseoviolacea]MCP2345460.1 threonine dehydrogenase-like Zn-dependent dehydrogenase [Nonomuraea roseoviolacea subsp. carminata]